MTKKSFTKKASEYVDSVHFDSKELNDYYDKFIFELYDNSLSKSLENINKQLHNTNDLINKVYDSCNARNRDLISNLRATGHLEQEVESDTPLYKEDKYQHMLKTHGYNDTLKELFDDFSILNMSTKTHQSSLNILKSFYIEISKLNREERRFRKKERLITKEYNESTT